MTTRGIGWLDKTSVVTAQYLKKLVNMKNAKGAAKGAAKSTAKGAARKKPVLVESHIQQSFITWCNMKVLSGEYPELALIMSIPNGAIQPRMRKRQIAEGMQVGAPDLFLPVARGGYHGLFVEVKSPDGRLSLQQVEMHRKLTAGKYFLAVCRNLADFIEVIRQYLTIAEDNDTAESTM